MIYKIHPAIGIARVGNSEEFYLAPEEAGGLPLLPEGQPFTQANFRDSQRRLCRQGVRFEILAYDENDPNHSIQPIRPGEGGIQRIEWTVHLANKKSSWYEFVVSKGETGYASDHPLRNADIIDVIERRNLITDPGPRTLSEPGQSVQFSRTDNPDSYPMTFPPENLHPHSIDSLGGLLTDAEGRLIVVGGYGNSGSTVVPPTILDYANNDRWWDDTSDGPVTARIVLDDGTVIEPTETSWVLVAPPRYAPELVNLVTLYDTLFDTAVRNFGLRTDIYANSLWNTDYQPNWEGDILPILERAHHYQWVVAMPPHPHNFEWGKLGDPNPEFNQFRGYYLNLLRSPTAPNLLAAPGSGYPLMPYLCGDNCFVAGPLASNYLTVTSTQYFYLQQWADGKFLVEPPSPLGKGEALDKATLENCVGGAFSPGIEVTWICRNPLLYSQPFRIRRQPNVCPPLSLGGNLEEGLEPGDLSRYMAIPWQADFNECSQQQIGERFFWWWPVQRPDFVRIYHHGHPTLVPWIGTDRDQNAPDYVQFADDLTMVTHWQELGFVFNIGSKKNPNFVEVDRVLHRHRHPYGGWEDIV